jgi:hypothetical protein
MKLRLFLTVAIIFSLGSAKKQDAASDLKDNEKFYDKTLLNLKTLEKFIADLLYSSHNLLDKGRDLRKIKDGKAIEEFTETLKDTETLRDSVQTNIKNQIVKIN